MPLSLDTVKAHLAALSGAVLHETWGETAAFYNPGRLMARGTYFATLKDADGPNDQASNLNRPGLWRLNIGVNRTTYTGLFGPPSPRPGKGETISGPWDFKATDLITPHPIYGWMSWIAVVAPTETTWRRCLPLIDDAHSRARTTFEKRARGLAKPFEPAPPKSR